MRPFIYRYSIVWIWYLFFLCAVFQQQGFHKDGQAIEEHKIALFFAVGQAGNDIIEACFVFLGEHAGRKDFYAFAAAHQQAVGQGAQFIAAAPCKGFVFAAQDCRHFHFQKSLQHQLIYFILQHNASPLTLNRISIACFSSACNRFLDFHSALCYSRVCLLDFCRY